MIGVMYVNTWFEGYGFYCDLLVTFASQVWFWHYNHNMGKSYSITRWDNQILQHPKLFAKFKIPTKYGHKPLFQQVRVEVGVLYIYLFIYLIWVHLFQGKQFRWYQPSLCTMQWPVHMCQTTYNHYDIDTHIESSIRIFFNLVMVTRHLLCAWYCTLVKQVVNVFIWYYVIPRWRPINLQNIGDNLTCTHL